MPKMVWPTGHEGALGTAAGGETPILGPEVAARVDHATRGLDVRYEALRVHQALRLASTLLRA